MQHNRGAVVSAVMGLSAAIAISSMAAAQENTNSSIPLDGITVTATKTGSAAIDTPAGASVITQEDINQIQPDRISDVFKDVPGVWTQEDGDDPASSINIRGLQDFGRVNVMIEGARQNFQRSGHGADGQFYLEPELVKNVDITRGPVSTIYGSGAIGGVVNFELIDPEDIVEPGKTWSLHTKGKYDTNDDGWLVSTTGAYILNDAVSVLGNVVWRDDDDYEDGGGNIVENSGEEVLSALAKSNITLGGGHDISLMYLYQDNDYVTGVTGTQRDTQTTDETYSAKWHFQDPNSDLIDMTVSAYHTSTDTEQVRIDTTPGYEYLLGNTRTFKIETVGIDGFNTTRFNTGAFAHTLTYGGDYFKDEVETADPLYTGDEFTPSGEREAYGAFVQDQVDFGELAQVTYALRYDGYELNGSDGSSDEGSRVSPKFTVAVMPLTGVQLFASYSEGYRAPAITEVFNEGTHDPAFPFVFLPNTDLDPETAKNREYGVNLKYDNIFTGNDAFRAKAVYFNNKVDDYIDYELSFFSPSNNTFAKCGSFACFQYVNIAKAELRGFELEASYDAGYAFAKVAYSRTRGDDKTEGDPLTNIQPDKLSAVLGARLLNDKLVFGGRWTHVDAQNRLPNVDDIEPSEAYDLFDIFMTYDVNSHFTMAVTLNNITDEEYTKYLHEDPSPGFNASVSATIKLGG